MKKLKGISERKRERRHRRIRAKVMGTDKRPRLAVFRSNKYIYAQLIDDEKGATLVTASDLGMQAKGTKVNRATTVGTAIAEKAKKAHVAEVVFDRGGFIFTGRVKALAEAARAGGLKF